ncbi:MAG: hypothetical protein ACJA2W_002208 [Planctomycetota bacterium]|jgi:hypothetical protein
MGDGEEDTGLADWGIALERHGGVLAPRRVANKLPGTEGTPVIVPISAREHQNVLWPQMAMGRVPGARCHTDQNGLRSGLG